MEIGLVPLVMMASLVLVCGSLLLMAEGLDSFPIAFFFGCLGIVLAHGAGMGLQLWRTNADLRAACPQQEQLKKERVHTCHIPVRFKDGKVDEIIRPTLTAPENDKKE